MADIDQIFPLRLSDFEHYAFRDDSPEHPMVIVLRVPFEGALNETAFGTALSETLELNPLLRAVVDDSGWSTKWRLLKEQQPDLRCAHFSGDHPPVNCRPRHFDLTQEPGVAFDLRLCQERGVLVSYFHHACADGLGAIRFLGDVFARYGQLTANAGEERPVVRIPDPSVLLKRGTTRMPGDRRGRCAPIIHTLMETCRLFCRKSYRILNHSPSPAKDTVVNNIVHTEVVPRAILKQLKKLAASKGVSTNDLFMMAFLQELANWSAQDTDARPDDLFRVLMPVSMRTPDLDEISVANVVSYVFHSYRRYQLCRTDSLLSAIHKKSYQMINRNEGAAMLHGFALTRWIPGLFGLSRKLQPDFASVVMTNVGEVRRVFENRFPLKQGRAIAGNVVLQGVDGIAPVRKNTNITIAFGTYGGELIVHLSRDTRLFSDGEADRLLASLVDRLVSLVDPRTIASESLPRHETAVMTEEQVGR